MAQFQKAVTVLDRLKLYRVINNDWGRQHSPRREKYSRRRSSTGRE